ncbi:MAG: cyclase family protein [Acidobacteriota bacterium]|nr:cyclase family protein [Acidobacteriota bacterium]
MSPRIYDISPPISEATQVFPGDTPPSREVLLDMKRGANLTLSTLRTTVHVGAHVDAPSHYGADAATIERVALDRCIGPCQVVRVEVLRGDLIGIDALSEPVKSERVLFATGTFPDPTHFNEDFAAFAPEMIDHLHDGGVRLVGIDTPSVDPASSKDLPSHRRCLAHDILILEGIVLDGVPEGRYELIAVPLRLVGFDGSPVRAVLRSPS